ncbi:MAG: hypothetical protein EOP06_09580 [Proteobacteria bacterium]|nr:MAG: hypothetical protein EOP06_09580 [Pseudomonadota bacterium]
MTEQNPYTTPSAGQLHSGDDPAALGELVREWEKLRLVYNGLMILPGIGVLALWVRWGMPLPLAVLSSVATGIGANVAFLLGPLSELYWRALFRQGAPIGNGRKLIFLAGLVISGVVVVLAAAIPLLF